MRRPTTTAADCNDCSSAGLLEEVLLHRGRTC